MTKQKKTPFVERLAKEIANRRRHESTPLYQHYRNRLNKLMEWPLDAGNDYRPETVERLNNMIRETRNKMNSLPR